MKYIAWVHTIPDGRREAFLDEDRPDGEHERGICLTVATGTKVSIVPMKRHVDVTVSDDKGLVSILCPDKVCEKTEDGWVTYLPLED